MPLITVLVVDDQPDIRLLVRMLIARDDRLALADEFGSGAEAVAFLHDGQATVVVLDQMMPGMTGIETATKILDRHPDQRIVLFSAYLDEALLAEAREVGIMACVDKRDFNDVVHTVRSVAAA